MFSGASYPTRFDSAERPYPGSSSGTRLETTSPITNQVSNTATKEKKKTFTHKLIRQRIHQLRLAPRQFRLSLKHLHRLVDLALLQAQLGEGRHRRLALVINPQSFMTASLGSSNILLPLIQRQTLVHEWEDVGWGSEEKRVMSKNEIRRMDK